MKKINLGKVAFTPKGEYQPSIQYKKLDIISYGGSSYSVLKDVTGVTPTNDGVNYTLVSSKGDPYDHSEEFSRLASEVRSDAELAKQSEQNINTIKTNVESIQSDVTEKAKVVSEKAQKATDEAVKAKQEADRAKTTVDSLPNPDWNQNDTLAKDYIKNKPFYEFMDDSAVGNEFSFEMASIETSGTAVELPFVLNDGDAYDCSIINSGGNESPCGSYTVENGELIINAGGAIYKVSNNNISVNKPFPVSGFRVSMKGKSSLKCIKIPEKYLPAVVGKGNSIHAEIFNDYENNKANGMFSHAEGEKTQAVGGTSHAEGEKTQAVGGSSHAEGIETQAVGGSSHAEGINTIAKGIYAHTEGAYTKANGDSSHAEGNHTIASSDFQHVQGRYNVEDVEDKYADIVGNGKMASDGTGIPSNASTLDWDGNYWCQGNIKIGGTGYDDVVAKTIATTEDIPVVDTAMSDTSTNLVDNKTIKTYVDELFNSLTNVEGVKY